MSLSDKRKELKEEVLHEFPELKFVFEKLKKQDKEFIKKLKEKDLYRALIERFGKVKVYDCCTTELFDLIEEYFNKKIDKLAGEELI